MSVQAEEVPCEYMGMIEFDARSERFRYCSMREATVEMRICAQRRALLQNTVGESPLMKRQIKRLSQNAQNVGPEW